MGGIITPVLRQGEAVAQFEAVRWVLFISAGWALGCEPEPLVLPLPFAAEARSAIVVLSAGDRTDLHGIDLATRNGMPLLAEWRGISAARPLTVTVASYREELDDLALTPGVLRSSEDGVLMPTPLTIEGGQVVDSVPALVPVEAPSALLAFRRPGDPECRATLILEDRWDLDQPGEPLGLVPLANGQVGLLQDRFDGTRVILRPQAASFTEDPPIPEADLIVRQAQIGPDLAMWLGGGTWIEGGRLGRYVNGTFEPILASTDPPNYGEWIAAFTFASPEEGEGVVYAVTQAGALQRIGRAGREVLVPANDNFGPTPTLAVVGPDEVFFVRGGDVGVLHYRGGVLETEATVLDFALQADSDRLLSLAVAADGSAFAGARSGVFLRRDPQQVWRTLGREVLDSAGIWSMLPFEAGVLAGGDYGALQQAYPGSSLPCEFTAYTNKDDSIRFLYLQDRVIWAGGLRRIAIDERRSFLARVTF
jgi:hypothetical protein